MPFLQLGGALARRGRPGPEILELDLGELGHGDALLDRSKLLGVERVAHAPVGMLLELHQERLGLASELALELRRRLGARTEVAEAELERQAALRLAREVRPGRLVAAAGRRGGEGETEAEAEQSAHGSLSVIQQADGCKAAK
jgi:hypothetical protein